MGYNCEQLGDWRQDIANVRTCQRWFSEFCAEDLSLQESDRSGRPSKIDIDVLRSMLEYNPHLTSREIAEEFGIHHTTVDDNIKSRLDKWNAVIKHKRPALAYRKGIVFHHDNALLHTAMVTQQKLNASQWEVLGHPPYSPDIAPSDYYLLRSLQNYLTGRKFKSFESVSKAVVGYFNSKDENFYKTGIHRLPERWQQVVPNNGAYIID
ncbi:mariner Mos1 transposase [Trichonephila clavipes]|nr:mariner Mos1 transposase [Trichonephila clavipes]